MTRKAEKGMEHSFELALALHCAPTLAALKPASLFRWAGNPQSLAPWKTKLDAFGLTLRALKRCPDGRSLFYLYRARWLRRILSDPDNAAFLKSRGYEAGEDIEAALGRLKAAYQADSTLFNKFIESELIANRHRSVVSVFPGAEPQERLPGGEASDNTRRW